MRKKWKKLTAVLAVTAMLLQQCGIYSTAEETAVSEAQVQEMTQSTSETAPAAEVPQTVAEAPTEEQTQAPTEEQTQAPTEAQTQAPTEAQTQAPTEAQTQAPTEEQTQAPTEAQTQVPTEAQTQVPTEAQTQAPTEAQTQASTETQTETSTETQTEKTTEKTTETTTERETERSARVNSGEKIKAAGLVSKLKSVLPYLFAAKSVQLPAHLTETSAEVQAVAENEETADTQTQSAAGDGASAGAAADTQADASTESEEESLALSLEDLITTKASYVDDLKKVSTELANAKSSGSVVVINVYADAKGKLDTTQLDTLYKNQQLDVTEQNFVINVIADSKNQNLTFSGYTMVSSGAVLSYKKDSEAGAVLYNFAAMYGEKIVGYEGKLTLTNGSGLQGTFLAPQADVTVKSDLAGAVYADKVTVTDSVKDLMRVALIEGIAEKEEPENTENTAEADIAETTAAETDAAEETAIPETTAAEMNTTEAAEETDVPSEFADEELLAVEGAMAAETLRWYSAAGSVLKLRLDDAANGSDAALAGSVMVSVKAAAEIRSETNAVVYRKGDEAAAHEFKTEEAYDIGADLKYAGIYYLEVNGGTAYLGSSRIYFVINENGTAVLEGSAWDASTGMLTVALHGTAETLGSGLKVTLTAQESGEALSGAAFVIKAQDGTVIRNKDGYPTYYISYAGAPVVLSDLAAGTYYLSQVKVPEGYQMAADQKFTVATGLSEVNVTNGRLTEGGNSLNVSAQTFYQSTLLTSETQQSVYAALFADAALTKRVSEVKELVYTESGKTVTEAVTFSGLAAGTAYYVAETDEFGELVKEQTVYETKLADEQGAEVTAITFAADSSGAEKNLLWNFHYKEGNYPTDRFSYMGAARLTLNVKDQNNEDEATADQFYIQIYRDAELKNAMLSVPITFVMDGKASLTETYSWKMTDASATYYVAETNADGSLVAADFDYAVTYPGHEAGAFTVTCGTAATVTIQNKLNDSIVKLGVKNAATGAYLAGAELVIKNAEGTVIAINNSKIFSSKDTEIEWKNLLEAGETYYLSEVKAPSGYTPAPDVAFTVKKGGTVEIVLENQKTASTNHKLTVTKQVYSGDYQVYAYDTTKGTYAAKGAYTFYAALFSDAARTQKVSDVQKITVSALGGTTTFSNLQKGKTYYVGETTQYGEVVASTDSLQVKYADSGKVKIANKTHTSVIQNVYSQLPKGYRYTGTLTITKNLLNASGAETSDTETFYAGIFRKADYSDTPTIVKLALKDASTVSVRRRILLSGEADMQYYIAEVDADGKLVADSSEFGYKVTVDQPSVTISRGDDKEVLITNQVKSSKVTLYLTKKVYEGTSPKSVNATFYAGLFKDADFTQPYTKPIAMQLNGKSELTLKLSLNLGNASAATIYVAEVNADGTVIKDEKSFGYEIKVVNSTAAFTQDRREIQAILINTAYGSVSNDDWQQILNESISSGVIGGGTGYSYGSVSSNGEASAVSDSVSTGDETPILGYMVMMIAALLILAGVCAAWVIRRKHRRV